MTKKKLLALFVLFVLLFVLVSPMLHINPANVAKADWKCQQMRCDCYVPYNYMGGRIWEGYLDPVFLTCSGWRPITPCEPYC